MKKLTFKLSILFLICSILASCGTRKKQDEKQETQVMEMRTVDNIVEAEEELPPPPLNNTIKFVPPVITEDCDKNIDITELSDQMVIVEEPSANRPHLQESKIIRRERINTEEYSSFKENSFMLAESNPLSTFSIDVDAASYSNVRRFINQGRKPYPDVVRVEEMINYFDYNYPKPTGDDPVHISTEVGASPWNKDNRLVKIGLKAKEIPMDKLPNSNFVFLIDVSGSMDSPNKLDLVKSSMKMLLENLRQEDRVAIVVYANEVGVKLESTPVKDKEKILNALNKLYASGGTSGGDGIILAYKVAEKNFIKGGNNRIILCTDGDFNIGMSSDNELERLIERKRESGVFLSILGYGMGNYKDKKMQTLAQAGNGNHAYIDNLQEANKVLVKELAGTMYTLAKDVKIQVEFNPTKVQAYRLVGYETRALNKEDFNDDTKDAGEMGVGHTVTALYEVVPTGVKNNMIPSVDPLKYQSEAIKNTISSSSKELLTVKMRYKQPDGDTSKLLSKAVIDNGEDRVSQDFRFASAVAMYGQLLRNSKYKGDSNYDKVIALAKQGLNNDEQGYRREFVRLVESTKSLE